MVNENVKPNEFQRQISCDVDTGKRKRHKSAGDYNKPRSQSVCENWRPRHVSGEDRLLMQFTGFEKDKNEDIFEVEIEKPEECNLSDEARNSDDTKDSGVVLDEGRVSYVDIGSDTSTNLDRPTSVPIDMKRSNMSSSLSAPETFEPSSIPHSIGTPVTENDPLGLFMDDMPIGNIPASNSLSKIQGGTNVRFGHCGSTPNQIFQPPGPSDESTSPEFSVGGANSLFNGNERPKTISSAGISSHECNIKEVSRTSANSDEKMFTLGSAQSLDAVSVVIPGGSGSQPLSPVEQLGKRLRTLGRTNSSPGSLENTDKSGRGFWPVKGYLQSISSSLKKSNDSLDEKPEAEDSSVNRTPEPHGRRIAGLRKHNERLSGALKYGWGALANKFSEIKQNISIPTKMGSNTSLTKTGDGDSLHGDDGRSQNKGAMDVPLRKSAAGSDRESRRGETHEDKKENPSALPVGRY